MSAEDHGVHRCPGKIGYDSANAAREATARIVARRSEGPRPMAYLCPGCGRFHIGRRHRDKRRFAK